MIFSPGHREFPGRDRKWPDFLDFGNTYLHLARSRVPESLWKPHQSKAINFLHRNCEPTFFPTPTKKFFFRDQKYFSKKISKNYFSVKIPKKSEISIFGQIFSNFRFFSGFSPINIFGRFFFEKYFWSRKNIFFFEVEKKSRSIASMQKIHSFRLVRFSERFRHSAAS